MYRESAEAYGRQLDFIGELSLMVLHARSFITELYGVLIIAVRARKVYGMDDIRVRLAKDGAFPINEELAGLVPMADENEQVALTQDIKENGQRLPITLWRGEVVDGRCRQKALVMLNRPIMYTELDDKLTKEEVRIYVKSVNTRRNLTMTQKVMSASREYLREGNKKSIAVVAKAWGVSDNFLKNAIYITKVDSDMADTLFNGGSIDIISSSGDVTQSNKVTAIYAHLKRLEEKAVEVSGLEEHGWKEDSIVSP